MMEKKSRLIIDDILTELNRVLKNGGLMLLTVPFCWNEHEAPYDFGRYTSYGLKHVLEKHGFRVVVNTKSGNFVRVNIQLWALYVYEMFSNIESRIIHYFLSMILIIPINIIGLLTGWLLPVNRSLYFNNIIIAQKK